MQDRKTIIIFDKDNSDRGRMLSGRGVTVF